VLRTILAHHDLSVVFDDLRLDLAGMLVHQRIEWHCTRDHCIANFFNAGWTETVSLTRETEWRSTALVGFQKRTRRPVRTYSFTFGKALIN
jgi:hypothetical protein